MKRLQKNRLPLHASLISTSIMAIIVLLSSSFTQAQQTRNISPAGTRFFLYTPPGYHAESGPYPLLVSLHGQVGIGDNLDEILQSRDETPAKLIAHGRWPSSYPFIVLSPQLKRDHSIPDPRDQDWGPAAIDEVIEHVKTEYAVDVNRIYLVGLSLGASGVWLYGAAYPEKVAAMVPISGVPDSTQGCSVKDIPTWVFHGENDGLIEPVFASGMVNAINSCQPPGKFRAHLTLMRARRHEGWSEVYNDSNGYRIYDWLLSVAKNDQGNKRPYVNAGSDLRMIQRDGAVHLYAEFFDVDGAIVNVQWTQTGGVGLHLEGSSHFLTLTSPPVGLFQFRITVTDDNGAQQSDEVSLEIIDAAQGFPMVTDLFLLNKNEEVITKLADGFIINPTIVGDEINIRAEANAASLSVRFRINNDHNTRTTNTPGPYLISNQQWRINDGEYLICATPFDNRGGRGNAGITQCYRIIVSSNAETPPPDDDPVEEPEPPEDPDDPNEEEPEPPDDDPEDGENPPPGDGAPDEDPDEPPTDEGPPDENPPTMFFAIAGKDVSLLSGWTSNVDGDGVAPTSFNLAGQQFSILDSAVLMSPLSIDGTGSVFTIKEGGILVVRSALSSPVNIEQNASLYVSTSETVEFGNIDPMSTVIFDEASETIPKTAFGNVVLRGSSEKRLLPGQTKILGGLVIDEGATLAGAEDLSSTLAVAGNVYIHENDGTFAPQPSLSIRFEGKGIQTVYANEIEITLKQLTIASTANVVLTPSCSLNLGDASGGGLVVESAGLLLLGENVLSITGNGAINPSNEGGKVAFNNAVLNIESNAARNSYLSVLASSDSLKALSVNLQSEGQLYITDPLYIRGVVTAINGSINSDGNIILVSDSETTAAVRQTGGSIHGDVQFQSFLPKGPRMRHITFPLLNVDTILLTEMPDKNVQVALSEFDDTTGDFIALSPPVYIHPGKGYAIQLPDSLSEYLVTASGAVNGIETSFGLTANPATDPARGWNLIGNPFLAPIKWSGKDQSSGGISSTIQVLDANFPFERYLVWDGETGDEELSGIIPQSKGFFVQTVDANPSLSIDPHAATDTTTTGDGNPVAPRQLTITLQRGLLIDRAFLKFGTDGTDSLNHRDGVKRRNGYFSLSSFSADSIALAINSLSEVACERTIGLLMNNIAPGAYSLSFDGRTIFESDWRIHLIDTKTDSTVIIKRATYYDFEIPSVEMESNRFLITIVGAEMPDPVITVEGNTFVSNYHEGNQWLLNGSPIPDATSSVFEPHVSGEYSLIVSKSGCAKESEPIVYSVTDVARHSAAISIFPNPAHKTAHVTVPHALIGANVQIVNMVGVSMMNRTIETNELLLDLEGFTPGVYVLSIATKQHNHKLKFVVR